MRPITALAAFALLAPAAGHAAGLDVKTGQWRVTTTMHMTGTFMPPEMLAKLPPPVREQMTARIAAMQQPQTRIACLTQENLDHGFDIGLSEDRHCQRHILQQTSSQLEIQADCTSGDGHDTEHGQFTAIDRQSMQGKFDIQRQGGGGPHVMSVEFAGTWVAAACTGKEDEAE